MVSPAPSRSLCGGWGYITVWCKRLPCLSSATTLHPVRKPGSMASTAFCPNGEDKSNWRRLSANTAIASSSALCFILARVSFSIEGASRRLKPSATAASIIPLTGEPRLTKRRNSCSSASSPSTVILTRKNPSSSPRIMASKRCDVMRVTGSSHS